MRARDMEKGELFDFVDRALNVLRRLKREEFTLQEIAEMIEAELGQNLDASALHEIRQIMHARWGSRVEPFGIGGQLWKFGHGKPPVSREILGR